MITRSEAFEIAHRINSDYDYYVEHLSAYVFSVKDAPLSFGGFDSPVIVMKDTGEIAHMYDCPELGMPICEGPMDADMPDLIYMCGGIRLNDITAPDEDAPC